MARYDDDCTEGIAYDVARELGANLVNYSPTEVQLIYGKQNYKIFFSRPQSGSSIELAYGINEDLVPSPEDEMIRARMQDRLKDIKSITDEFYVDGYQSHPLSVWAKTTLDADKYESAVLTAVELAQLFQIIADKWWYEEAEKIKAA